VLVTTPREFLVENLDEGGQFPGGELFTLADDEKSFGFGEKATYII
jgi:hypothetical protein